ncbi:hypothetical protein LSP03_04660 [Lysinibacillus sphaericus]|nr:hypothetical protein LSP03_04660 [Lysinibacillus sphaericus]
MVEKKKKESSPTPITSAGIIIASPFKISHDANNRTPTSSQADLCAASEATSTASAT